ncbi:secondary thiamine-phosphate synthase enzyme YjbQ [Dehalococcoidia bacterium]|nr:secondary thiamine-phosphate synthase enzyme YjbQ [Dehalococcoidia bacterium]
MKVTEAPLKTYVSILNVRTNTAPEFIDITDRVEQTVKDSEIYNGFVLVYSKHTTAAIKIQENEPLLLEDMARLLENFAPQNGSYRHNDFDVRTVHMHEDECPNGHSHCQHLVLSTSETLPLINGSMPLGQFQRIFLVELDNQKSEREVLVQILGV